MRTPVVAIASLTLLLTVAGVGSSEDLWAELGPLAARMEALPPTPTGDGHIGLVESGAWVALRFPVPAQKAAGYWIGPANIVAYSGQGSSYQLILRRDAETGPVIYQGPVITNGDAWNTSNQAPVDLTAIVTDNDRHRGYLDVYATALVEGDGWTIYRHNPGRPVLAYAALMTPELEHQRATTRALRERSISVLPVPKNIQLDEGDLPLTSSTRIVYASGAPAAVSFAAAELQAVIQERTGMRLQVEASDHARMGGHINLGLPEWEFWGQELKPERQPRGAEGYVVYNLSDKDGVMVMGGGAAGCFYGAMTVGQMARRTENGAAVPCCIVEDYPSFPYRIIQYDIARGQTVNVDYVKRMIRELARCKINGLLFYMEDDFRFRKYPFLGREGTFTHEKARELSDYARQYHMQLIPQFESLGHASAVLAHEELKQLRENGNPWIFCTREPGTWEFLDDVFGELAEAFPDSEFIHVGGDEFEYGFGECPRCREKIAADGIGGLYTEHMNSLNQLVKKRGRTMLFWPAHWGPTPETTQMTLQYHDRMDKDCIPTEWIYHGPASYPEIERYQAAGFKDVFCCPAVESYSRIWPDNVTTLRGIQGFYRAGEARGCGGAYCTTWEFMYGALVENSWYGLLFAAECSWSPASTSRSEWDRRFADIWWGLRGPQVVARMQDTVFDPVPATGPESMWRNRMLVPQMVWVRPDRVMREFALKQPVAAANADTLVSTMDAALERAEALAAAATRNELTWRSLKLAMRMMRYGGQKVAAFRDCTRLYTEATDLALAAPAAAAERLALISARLDGVREAATDLATEYRYFVDHCGAWVGDWENLESQARQLTELVGRVGELATEVRSGQMQQLPPGGHLGFLVGRYEKLGQWAPEQMSEDGTTLAFDASGLLTGPGPFQVEWEYTDGAHGLRISKTQLLCNGQVVSEDIHSGWAGSGSGGNVYRLELKHYDPGAQYQIVGSVASAGGKDSRGTVWLILP